MNHIKLMILFSAVFLISIFGNSIAFAGEPSSKLSYEFSKESLWKTDVKDLKVSADQARWVLKEDPTIDILFSFSEGPLQKQFQEDGAQATVQQIMKGKNQVQSLVSDKPIMLLKTNSEKVKGMDLLTLELKYEVNQKTFMAIEKYYFGKNESLHATLRWGPQSKAGSISTAKKALLQLKVHPVGERAL